MTRLQLQLGESARHPITVAPNPLSQAIHQSIESEQTASRALTIHKGLLPVVTLSAFVVGEPVQAATFSVTDLGDAGPGTLRQAVLDANAAAGPDLVLFDNSLNGTITLTSGQIDITDDVLVQGPGAANVTVSGNNASRHFNVDDGDTDNSIQVEIAGLTLRDGSEATAGGSIRNAGGEFLTVRNSTISGNQADGSGGGIYSRGGIVEVVNSTLNNNTASAAESSGGAITIRSAFGPAAITVGRPASLIIRDSYLSGNYASDFGGAIYAEGTSSLVIDNTTITGNTAGISGGGIDIDDTDGPALIANSIISNNYAADQGGGITVSLDYYGDDLTIDNTQITGNTAANTGGGLHADESWVVIQNNSQINNNVAEENGGGIFFSAAFKLDALIIENSTISGNSANGGYGGGIHMYAPDSDLTIRNTTISNNYSSTDGGGIAFAYSSAAASAQGNITLQTVTLSGNSANNDGGGLFLEVDDQYGQIIIEDSVISSNVSGNHGGGLHFYFDDGLYTVLEIRNTTIADNTANAQGGGLWFYDDDGYNVLIENSTISGNDAADGGGIWFYSDDGDLILRNSTVSGNSALGVGGGIVLADEGSGFLNNITVTNNTATTGGGLYTPDLDTEINGSIFSGNTATTDPDLSSTGIEVRFSLIGDVGNATLTIDDNNLIGVDPLLGPLADNGGLTLTHALGAGSPAIDAAINFAALPDDQRGSGLPRMVGLSTDMGAFESDEDNPFTTSPATFIVANLDDAGAGSLRQAILDANGAPGQDVIEFQAGLSGTITLTTGEMPITDDLIINAPVPSVITIDANQASRIFRVNNSNEDAGTVELIGLTLTNGSISSMVNEPGAAIFNEGGEHLTVRDSALTNNSVNDSAGDSSGGGAIRSYGGVTRIIDSTLSGNYAGDGGGAIHVSDEGSLIVRNSMLMNNFDEYSGAIHAENTRTLIIDTSVVSDNTATASYGGGIGIEDPRGSILITNSTISGNYAYSYGGAISVTGLDAGNTVTIDNSQLTNNTAAYDDGGAIHVDEGYGTLKVVNSSTISGNYAYGDGGGIDFRSDAFGVGVVISDSTISNNSAGDGDGGGLNVYGEFIRVQIQNSTISNNSAAYDGGGLSVVYSSYLRQPIEITNSTLMGNTAGDDGGGLFVYTSFIYGNVLIEDSLVSGNTGDEGGGMHIYFEEDSYGRTVIDNSTVTGNLSMTNGGGILFYDEDGAAPLVITNSTISNNTATDNGGGLWMYSDDGALKIRNSTFTGNSAGDKGGAMYLEYSEQPSRIDNSTITGNTAVNGGGGIYATTYLEINSSIIAGNVSAAGAVDIGTDDDLFLQFNLIQNDTSFGSATIVRDNFNQFGVDPLLGALADNGGDTETVLIGAGSPVINRGLNFASIPTDQRRTGFLRTEGGRTDVGAVEVASNPLLNLASPNLNFAENGGVTTISATLTEPPGAPVVVDLNLTGTGTLGTDFTASTPAIFFPAGAVMGDVSLDLTGIDDNIDEDPDETVIVDAVAVRGATRGGTTQLTATIIDDDATPLTTLNLAGSPLAENGGVATLTANLTNPSSQDITVNLAFSGTAGASDFSAPTSIVIAAGDTQNSIDITGVDDIIDELDETVIADIDTVTNALEDGVQQQTATITDDDPTPLVTLSLTGSPLAENGGAATLTANLSNPSSQDITVNLVFSGTAAGTDFNAPTSIVIPAGDTQSSIDITGVDDPIDEPDETVIVDIDTVINGLEDGVQQQTATITDDDAAPQATLSLTGSPFAENGGVATLTADLSNPSAQDVTVNLAFSGTADATDFNAPTSIVVPAGSLQNSIAITGVDDPIDEVDETVVVDIDTVINGTEAGVQQQTAVITDDDAPPLTTLSLAGSPLAENGGVATLTANIANPSSLDVTVNLAFSGTADATDFNAPNSIVISAGDTQNSIDITGVDDALDEADETVIVDIDTITNGTEDGVQQQTATITDDDAPPLVTISLSIETISEGGDAEVILTLNTPSGQDIEVELGFSGTATMPDDYTVSSTMVTIPAGQLTGSVFITAVNDGPGDPNETIIIDVINVTNGVEDGEQQGTLTLLEPIEVPTMSTWGKLAMMLMLPFTAFFAMRRRRQKPE